MGNETSSLHKWCKGRNIMVFCRVCGKRCHSSIEGCVDICLCRKCFDKVNLENEHSDGHHKEFNPECVGCVKDKEGEESLLP